MTLIPLSTLKASPKCGVCGTEPVETVITQAGRLDLCPDHLSRFAARRLSPQERVALIEKQQPQPTPWQTGPCALCMEPADLLFEEREGTFAFCQPHFIRYVLWALRPNEHAQLSARLTPDQFLTRVSSKHYFEGQAERPYFEDLNDPAYSVTAPLWEEPSFLNTLVRELERHPVNTNDFFQAFKDRHLSRSRLQAFLRQYHYFCKHFVKVLEGLLYRTPLDELDMRVELAKTLHSELGSGSSEQAHIRLLERFAEALGVSPDELARTEPIPEVQAYLALLRRLFIESDYLTALGAEMAVEITAAAEFKYFLPGLKKYGTFPSQALVFFEMHIEAEDCHGAWLTDAVRKTARTQADLDQVAVGARTTADAWQAFWQGMYREVFDKASVEVA